MTPSPYIPWQQLHQFLPPSSPYENLTLLRKPTNCQEETQQSLFINMNLFFPQSENVMLGFILIILHAHVATQRMWL